MKNKEKINPRLQGLRQQTRLSQQELAEIAGVSDTCYQNYEYGDREPKVRTAIRIAKALNTTVEELWDSNPTK